MYCSDFASLPPNKFFQVDVYSIGYYELEIQRSRLNPYSFFIFHPILGLFFKLKQHDTPNILRFS